MILYSFSKQGTNYNIAYYFSVFLSVCPWAYSYNYSTCDGYYAAGFTTSGSYSIDPEGDGDPILDVVCNFTTGTPWTILHHDQEEENYINGYKEKVMKFHHFSHFDKNNIIEISYRSDQNYIANSKVGMYLLI